MEITIIIVVGLIFSLLGLACVVSVAVGVPGTWIMLGLAVLIELVDGLWLSDLRPVTFGWWYIAGGVAVAGFGEGLEFIAGLLGAAKAGSSRKGMIGALVGGVVGAIFGTFIPFLPIVGSLLGAFVGTFVGAIAGELSHDAEATVRGSLRPATGATIGRILGTLAKVPLALAVWIGLSVLVFWP